MIPVQVLQLASFCKEAGIRRFFVSPGSRSAPLVLAISRIGGMDLEMVMDERSAAYKALGWSLVTGKPSGLLCTSGTAVLNYGPAIAEAFYQQIPLFVVTADRPPEWIDQNEGQAIRQAGIFQLHTRFQAVLPSTDDQPAACIHNRRILNEAFFHLHSFPHGPVHINVPLREPLYPVEAIEFSEVSRFHPAKREYSTPKLDREVLSPLVEIWNSFSKRLLVVGQHSPDSGLNNAMTALSEYGNAPVLGDFLNNLKGLPGQISCADAFKSDVWADPNLKPEILITLGNGLLSKNTKQFLAGCLPVEHWHIQEAGFPVDPYGTITRVIHTDPAWFLTRLGEVSYFSGEAVRESAAHYFQQWTRPERQYRNEIQSSLPGITWSDLKATGELIDRIPDGSVLFAGNSMAVRYANYFGFLLPEGVCVYANRGTSGIDGCLSTACGIAMAAPEKTVVVLLGDMSFFYDRNALWTNGLPNNLKICILNNGGGNIFRIIPGSGAMPELEALFELNQPFNANYAASEAGIRYLKMEGNIERKEIWNDFFSARETILLECLTDKLINHETLKTWKSSLGTHENT